MALTPYLRARTHTGWTTKPAADDPANALTAEEVDGNFLWLQSMMKPSYVVAGKHFGGVPGSASSQVLAINDAATAAETAGGGVVTLTPGEWLIDASVLLGDNVTLHLMYGAILKQMNGSNIFPVTNKDTTNGNTNVWVVGGGLIDGNKENQTTRFSTVALVRSSHCGALGIAARGGLRTGTFPTVSRHGEGIEIIECDDAYVMGCRAYENSYDGIKGAGSNGLVIANNRTWDNGRSGVQLYIHKSGGEFSGTGNDSVRADGCLNWRIYGNRNTHVDGVSSGASPRTAGLYLHTASDGLMWGNLSTGCAHGIGGYGATEDNRIFGNAVGGFEDALKFATAEQINNSVYENDLFGEGGSGGDYIEDNGAGNIFRNNRVKLRGSGAGTWVMTANGTNARFLTNDPDDVTVTDNGTGTEVQRFSDFGSGSGYSPSLQTLTDAANITWDLTPGNIAEVTLGGNRTLDNPSTLTVGTYPLIVRQDATGSRTLSFGDAFIWPGGTPPTLTTTPDDADLLIFECDGTNLFGRSTLDYTPTTASVTVSDAFNDGDGSAPTGWTQEFNTTNVTYSEDASGFLRQSKGSTDRTALSWDTAGSVADLEVLAKVRSDTQIGDATYTGIIVRGGGSEGAEAGYIAALFNGSAGGDSVIISRYDAGTFTGLGKDEATTWATNTWQWIRFRVSGTSLKMRHWTDGDSEPGTWNIEITDSALTSGWVGIFGFSAHVGDVDWIGYDDGGGTVAVPGST